MVAIVIEPSQALEVVLYQRDQILEDYLVSKRLGIKTLFYIKPGWLKFYKPIKCHNITIFHVLNSKYQKRFSYEFFILVRHYQIVKLYLAETMVITISKFFHLINNNVDQWANFGDSIYKNNSYLNIFYLVC